MSFRFRRTSRKKPRIDIVPMVDIMTFLIVFFMLFTTFRTNPAGLDIKLPRAETATPQQASTTIVTIDKSGNVYLDDKKISLDNLKLTINQRIQKNPNEIVVIRADDSTSYQKLVDVMDVARLAGAAKLALAAEIKRK
ncbi:MAG: biopolymer transporter ExbD [Firmicutes bacterium]|nr:biopolymer transporter ExbD [Bacillota bacterium]